MSKSPTRFGSILVAVAVSSLALASAASAQILEDIMIVDSPTAGVLPHGGYMFYGSLGPESSILAGFKIGFFDRVMMGASFGLQKFIGRGTMAANDKLGLELRLRFIDENERRPAFAVGIDTQGEDWYLESAERYERKSKGIYLAASKNYRLIEDFSIHAGAGYSLENRDEGGPNIFGGFSLELVKGFSLLADYNAALDDNSTKVATHLTRGKGYLDTGLRFDYRDNVRFKILFKDLLDNYIPESGVFRSFEVFYVNSF